MRLTDNEILKVISDLGTATSTQILREVKRRWPDQDKSDTRIRAMLPSLLKFRFIEYTTAYGKRYYYLEGTTPDPAPEDGYIIARISEFLTLNAPKEYTSRELADHIGGTPGYIRQVLTNTPGIVCTQARRASTTVNLYKAIV